MSPLKAASVAPLLSKGTIPSGCAGAQTVCQEPQREEWWAALLPWDQIHNVLRTPDVNNPLISVCIGLRSSLHLILCYISFQVHPLPQGKPSPSPDGIAKVVSYLTFPHLDLFNQSCVLWAMLAIYLLLLPKCYGFCWILATQSHKPSSLGRATLAVPWTPTNLCNYS